MGKRYTLGPTRLVRKTKDLTQRREQSEILKNLCRSAGVFFDLMTDTMMANGFPDDEGHDPFGEED